MLQNIMQNQAVEMVHKHFQPLSRKQLEIWVMLPTY